MTLKKIKAALAVGAAAFSLFAYSPEAAAFQEYPIGDEQESVDNHFKVALVYFQPVPMEPQGMMLSPDQADIHIETDIHATEGNECGFGVGEWIPYMRVEYKLTKVDSKGKPTGEAPITGTFMPMSADDGPHYGANVKMQGSGNYECEFKFYAPEGYALHTDEDTGVKGHLWKEPVVMKWNFRYVQRKW